MQEWGCIYQFLMTVFFTKVLGEQNQLKSEESSIFCCDIRLRNCMHWIHMEMGFVWCIYLSCDIKQGKVTSGLCCLYMFATTL